MAVFRKGDIFEASGIILFGAGSSVNGKGQLTMDPQTKHDLSQLVPGISSIFGKVVLETYGNRGLYGVILHGKYGVYQTGYGLNDLDLDVLQYSIDRLSSMARLCSDATFNVYCPDISNGRLEYIGPLVLMFPDNVHVWIKREVR